MKVAPINLPYNVKTLWFDPQGLDIVAADAVVVETARGRELGRAASDLIEVSDEDIAQLKSPLKPVVRLATEEDLERAKEMEERGREAMPVFKELARETSEDMHPVSVEFLLEGDKAIFYFEAEERIDFRDLVRQLASRFHVRVDMRQIGVRDEARIVGGLGHCGQMVCCKRLGGEFKPVSIRMAKDQDLSLNQQKISGLCGRLMCCLRYENEIYKEFNKHAPKVGAEVQTPDGPAKVTEHDVPRDSVVVKVPDEPAVKVPISAFEKPEEGSRPSVITQEGWDEVHAKEDSIFPGVSEIFPTARFTGTDKLGTGEVVHHGDGSKSTQATKQSGKPRRSSKSKSSTSAKADPKRTPRRRSTKISANGEGETKRTVSTQQKRSTSQRKGADQKQKEAPTSKRKQKAVRTSNGARPGQRSSGLSRSNAAETKDAAKTDASKSTAKNHNRRPRKRRAPKKDAEE